MKRTGPTNPHTKRLIEELKKRSVEGSISLWKRIANDLEKPARSRRVVNLSRINRFTKEDEIVVVPGKVLGSGELSHKVTISALDFSQGALEKIRQADAKAMPLNELLQEDPKGRRIRIIG
ncbi:50S ribosomal protein L18e [Candidatus Woesearchaeota archaeon]|nr:50S ribosomal protein L18e [Candidatus Woesearchaeota archaeon]